MDKEQVVQLINVMYKMLDRMVTVDDLIERQSLINMYEGFKPQFEQAVQVLEGGVE